MGVIYKHSITEPLNPGADFYGGLDTASASVAISSSLTCIIFAGLQGSSNIDIVSNVIAGKVTHNAASDISIISSVLTRQPIIFGPAGVDSGLIRTLILLDDKPLTNHNRILSQNITLSVVDNSNWNAKRGRYYKKSSKSGREQFNISWSFLPNYREKTVDQGYARDYLAAAASDPDIHTLKIINQDESGTTPYSEESYNVFIRSYDENLVRRDLSDGVYYFDCQITLEEV